MQRVQAPSRGRGRDNGSSSKRQSHAIASNKPPAPTPAIPKAVVPRPISVPSSASKTPAAGRASKLPIIDKEDPRPTSGRGRGRGAGGNIPAGRDPIEATRRLSSSAVSCKSSATSASSAASKPVQQPARSTKAIERRDSEVSLPLRGPPARIVSRTYPTAAAPDAESRNDLLDERLKQRIAELTLKQKEVRQNAQLVNTLTEEIVRDLNQRVLPKLKWTQRNAGSYYDKTKVIKIWGNQIEIPCSLSAHRPTCLNDEELTRCLSMTFIRGNEQKLFFSRPKSRNIPSYKPGRSYVIHQACYTRLR